MKRLCNALLLACSMAAFGSEIRVRTNNGVPQIQVDGRPVRPRWFWGGPAMPVQNFRKGEHNLEVNLFPTDIGLKELTFHMRFQRKPLNVWIDDFEVLDMTDGTTLFPKADFSSVKDGVPEGWTWFPRDERNTVGKLGVDPTGGKDGGPAMKIEIRNPPPGGTWPDFHVYSIAKPLELKAGHEYKLKMWLKADSDNSAVLMGYRPASPSFVARFSARGYEDQIRMAHAAGVDFISPPCPLPWPRGNEAVDWRDVDNAMTMVLMANPQAKIVPRIPMEPPTWWKQENPAELMGWQGAKVNHGMVSSVSSLKWQREAGENLRRLIEHLEATFPQAMAGYHPAGQNTSEWFYMDSWGQDYHGYSSCEQQAFRSWLLKKYQTDARLQAAWKMPAVTLAAAPVPSPEVRNNAPAYGMLLLPGQAQQVIDHNLFLQDEMTNAVKYLAKVVRDASKGKKLSVFFYGYGFEFSGMNRMSACGHLALRKLLECPDIDILCSPISYFDRELGGGGHSMTVAESVQKAGKLWLYEDDTRTYLAAGGNLGGLSTHLGDQWESRQVLVRNTAEEICRNFACWWMDLMRLGWYRDPALWQDMRDLGPMEQQKIDQPVPYNPPVACIFDEYSAAFTKGGRNVSAPLISLNRSPMSRMGAAYGQYLLDDLLAGKVPSRLAIMLNPWVLNAAQRQQLKAALNNKFTLWCHAPGIIDADGKLDNVKATRELTGYDVFRLDGQSPKSVNSTPEGRKLGLPEKWNVLPDTSLLLGIHPAHSDTVLATWPDGSAAVVLRKNSLFCATTQLPVQLLHLTLAQAGIHIYTDAGCVFYTDGRIFVIHATKEGPVTLRLPQPMLLTDGLTQKPISASPVISLKMNLKFGETRVLYCR